MTSSAALPLRAKFQQRDSGVHVVTLTMTSDAQWGDTKGHALEANIRQRGHSARLLDRGHRRLTPGCCPALVVQASRSPLQREAFPFRPGGRSIAFT